MADENNEQVIEDDPIEVRRAKREALSAEGTNPYGHALSSLPHSAAWMRSTPSSMAKTPKMMFPSRAVLWPSARRARSPFSSSWMPSGRIQLFCRINALGEDAFAEMKDLDLGDWIGVHGLMMRTRRGQLSVAV